MDIRVYRPDDMSGADRAAWTTTQLKAPQHGSSQMANPFLSPEFATAMGRHRRGVRVAVLREDGSHGEPVAFFPYQRTPTGVGRAIGLGLSDCQGLVHGPGFRWEAHELLAACGLAIWEFDHLAEGQQPFEESITGTFPSPVIDVADGWDAYVARMRERSARGTRVRLAQERKLGQAAGGVRYVHDERDPAMLRTLMEWKSAQYRRTGRSDRFAHQWITRLVEQLFHTRTESFSGLLSVLYAGGRPAALHFGLRSQHLLACWFTAYDPVFAKFSPGVSLHLRMAQGAAGDGLAYLDLGRGQRDHKDALKTRELCVSEGWVTRRHPVALAHQARRAPARALRNTVVARPELRRPADRLLRSMGRVRAWKGAS
ncbi:cellulose biosynthesis protein CelD [Streptomyces sp. A244]|uniref:GNAT family N-acetyltransferase n=1 Tax=Streptomyces sp. A244 TaxID=2137016 RepID=UPI000D1B1A84|nr:GNAT family N-acetyltransferase [Streptomyces sp. A244]PTH90168.1 cellulose biosynthesis protein CelD [Streptomyces sp. A244]